MEKGTVTVLEGVPVINNRSDTVVERLYQGLMAKLSNQARANL